MRERISYAAALVAYYASLVVLTTCVLKLRYLGQAPPALTWAFLAAIAAAEVLLAWRFEGHWSAGSSRTPGASRPSRRVLHPFLCVGTVLLRTLVNGAAVWHFIEAGVGATRANGETTVWRDHAPVVFDMLRMMLSTVPVLAALSGAVWLGLVWMVVVVRRRFRFVLVQLLPLAASYGLAVLQYENHLPQPGLHELARQPGVSVVFDPTWVARPDLAKVWDQPRKVIVSPDRNVAFLSFASIRTDDPSDENFWRVDLRTRTVDVAKMRPLRYFSISRDGSHVLAMPVHEHFVDGGRAGAALLLDAETLTVEDRVDLSRFGLERNFMAGIGVNIGEYDLVGIVHSAWLLKLHTATGRLDHALDLVEAGVARRSGLCCSFASDPIGRRVFVSGGNGVEPFLAVLSDEDLEVLGATRTRSVLRTLVYRPQGGGEVYGTSDVVADVLRVDPTTLEATFVCEQPMDTRLEYDPFRDRLFFLDYQNGRVSQATVDCTLERTWEVGRFPALGAFDADGVYVLSTQGILRLDLGGPTK
jgi:hypothetical protein